MNDIGSWCIIKWLIRTYREKRHFRFDVGMLADMLLSVHPTQTVSRPTPILPFSLPGFAIVAVHAIEAPLPPSGAACTIPASV
jgi:hypothetical protein